MKKSMILGGAALIAVAATAAGVATAQDAAVRPDRDAAVTRQQVIERADQRFARLDLNNDGQATADEARQAHEQRRAEHAGRMFERIDLNHDGNISRSEFEQVRGHRGEGRAAGDEGPGRHHGRRGMHGMRGGGHAAMCGEQGFVTREQMRERALERFDRLDANHDGTLTADERRQGRSQWRDRARERSQAD